MKKIVTLIFMCSIGFFIASQLVYIKRELKAINQKLDQSIQLKKEELDFKKKVTSF